MRYGVAPLQVTMRTFQFTFKNLGIISREIGDRESSPGYVTEFGHISTQVQIILNKVMFVTVPT